MRLHSLSLGVSLMICLLPSPIHSSCYDPSPAFPLPQYDPSFPELQGAFRRIETKLKNVLSSGLFNTTSFSLEVTSSKETLWTLYHTAEERDETRLGAAEVNGSSVYRIASITKVFTVLGILQQHVEGKLNMDDTIDKYIPELREEQEGSIPWKDITLRTLASQLSGIPNNFAQSDILTGKTDPTTYGLPPMSRKGLLKCDSFSKNYEVPCSREDLLKWVRAAEPVFPPKQQSTYSNIAFELLGLALEAVMKLSYAEAISSSILEPLGMNSTSIAKPSDDFAVLPKGVNYWDVDEGVQNPTGGLYSASTDLSVFLRHLLKTYNGLTPTLNFLAPASFADGSSSFFGMPWEIYRTASILPHTKRPVTFVTKSGGLPAYSSNIILLPEYDLGITILVGGTDLLNKIREVVTVELVRAAEAVALRNMQARYAGLYVAREGTGLNSSIALKATPRTGLSVSSWISNGTDILAAFWPIAKAQIGRASSWRAQLVPTLLFRDEKNKQGEIWRVETVPERDEDEELRVWDDFCLTLVDNIRYAGVPVNEVVFWGGEEGMFEEIELSAFRVKLGRRGDAVEEAGRGGTGIGWEQETIGSDVEL